MKKRTLYSLLFSIIFGFGVINTNYVIGTTVEYNISYDSRIIKPIDFKDDKKKATEWGKKEHETFQKNLNPEEAELLSYYVEKNKDNFETTVADLNFRELDDVRVVDREKLRQLDHICEVASISNDVIAYKNISARSLGFNEELFSQGQPNIDSLLKLHQQLDGKKILIDNYLVTDLNIPTPKLNNDIVIKIKVKGGEKLEQAGIWPAADTTYKMFINQQHSVLSVKKMTHTVIKGKACVLLEADLNTIMDAKGDDDHSVETTMDTVYTPWRNKLSSQEKNSLETYADDSTAINSYLREGKEGTNTILDNTIKNITQALEMAEIPSESILYRRTDHLELGLQPDDYPIDQLDRAIRGKTIEPKNFISTSMASRSIAGLENKKYILRLIVPKNYSAAPLTRFSTFAESEMLLQRNSRYYINSVKEMLVKGKKMFIIDGYVFPMSY